MDATNTTVPSPNPATPTPDPAQIREQQKRLLGHVARVTASWFNWIAGLSIVNTVLTYTHARLYMLGGLGITRICDYVGMKQHGLQGITFGLDIFLAVMYFAIGAWAVKGKKSAFVLGMALYALDALIYVPFVMQGLWVDLAFHAYVLYRLFPGLKAATALQRLNG
ncbi:MAG: hypothetical protein ACYCW6_06220 [Candidatus Xenobia bacterium]